MVNYYDILKVSPKSSGNEIKSAYRSLARKLHPDRNNGSKETALKFAAIAEAYEVLGNAKERARYDRRLADIHFSENGNSESVFTSTNRHAQRWRQMVYEKRYNDIIDRMIAEERREAMAFQKAIYPLVALLVTAILAAAAKPKIFAEAGMFGKIVIVALFIAGVIKLISRIKDAFQRFTDVDDDIHDSILDDGERKARRFPRTAAAFALGAAFLLCVGIGLVIGMYTDFAATYLPSMFSTTFGLEFLLYLPIVTFFVDLMHSFASGLDR